MELKSFEILGIFALLANIYNETYLARYLENCLSWTLIFGWLIGDEV